jgi:hypothetical protein
MAGPSERPGADRQSFDVILLPARCVYVSATVRFRLEAADDPARSLRKELSMPLDRSTRPTARLLLTALLAFPTLILASTALGQDELGLGLMRPHASLTIGGTPNADLRDVPGEFGSRAVAANLTLPIVGSGPGEGATSRLQLLGHVTARSADTDIAFLGGNRTYYSGVAGLSAVFTPSVNDSFVASLGVGLAGDESTVGDSGLRGSGLLLGVHRTSRDFSFSYGLSYTYLFGEGRLLPSFGIDWQPAASWRVRILLPFAANVRYRASERWTIGFRTGVDGNRYSVANGGSFPGQSDTLQLRETGLRAGLEAAVRVGSGVSIRAEGGVAAARKLSVHDGDVELLSTKVDAAPYGALTLGFAFGDRGRIPWDADR